MCRLGPLGQMWMWDGRQKGPLGQMQMWDGRQKGIGVPSCDLVISTVYTSFGLQIAHLRLLRPVPAANVH